MLGLVEAHTGSPATRASTRFMASSTVTRLLSFLSTAASSSPMKPPPITPTRSAPATSARRRSTSARVRTTWTPARSPPGAGRARGLPPAAQISLPQPNASPWSVVAACAAASTAAIQRPSHVAFGPERLRAEQHPLERLVAGEIVLRQRRPLVGRLRLVADERDRTSQAALPQRDRTLRTRLARTDDQNVESGEAHPRASRQRPSFSWVALSE